MVPCATQQAKNLSAGTGIGKEWYYEGRYGD